MRSKTLVSPSSTSDTRWILRLYYLVWQIILALVLTGVLFNSGFNETEKVIVAIIGGLICTFVSFLLGVRVKITPIGGIIDATPIKSKLSIWVFLWPLCVQTSLLWGKFFQGQLLNASLALVLAGFTMLSLTAIKIQITDQSESV